MKSNHLLCIALLAPPLLAWAGTPIDQTRPLDADGRVSIENIKGSVQVRTWDRNEVHIGGSLGDGVKQLQIEGGASSVRIKVDYHEGSGWFSTRHPGPSDLVVTVTATAGVDVDVARPDDDVSGVAGKRLALGQVRRHGKEEEKP